MKACLHCHRELPEKSFWGGRRTCAKCARELWYKPRRHADPRESPHWPTVRSMLALGLVRFPADAFIGEPPPEVER